MAIDMFMKIDDVLGESKDRTHVGEIDVLAWSFGESSSATTHPGGGAAVGKVTVQDLSFTKYVDRSSPALMLQCANGRHYRSARLTIRKAGDRPLEFLVVELSDVIVRAVNVAGSTGEDRVTENVTLNFAKFTYSYTPQKVDGGADLPVVMGWDILQNTSV